MALNVSQIVKPVAVIISMLFLAACSSQSTQSSSMQRSGAESVLPVEINELLTANSQDVSVVISSGLNKNRNLTASATYFAASGRFCRKIVISDDLADEQYIACSAEARGWELVRIII